MRRAAKPVVRDAHLHAHVRGRPARGCAVRFAARSLRLLRPQECARKCAVGSLTCDYCDAVKKFAAQAGTLGVAAYP